MHKTVAVYQDMRDGMYRIGLFTHRGIGSSVYAISQAFHAKYPEAHKHGKLYVSQRVKMNGRYVDDSQRYPMDLPESCWVTLCRRTNDPKLRWIEDSLSRMGIPHRRRGESFHAPILEVPEYGLERADAFLQSPVGGEDNATVDDIDDDDPRFDAYRHVYESSPPGR
jgi:hypothetical protein